MRSILDRWLPSPTPIKPLKPGIYHYQADPSAPLPYRLHLRLESDGRGVLIVNASTVLHLNPSAAAHALNLVEQVPERDAAGRIAARFRVSRRRAMNDFRALQARIVTLATNPDVDPVTFLGLERSLPDEQVPSAPYRLDLALTYACDPDGQLDPLARARVDRELSQEEWQRLLSLAWEAGIPHVTFTGGEPLRHAALPELVAYAEALGMVTGVLSEGRRLADQTLVAQLAQAGLDHFLISLVPDSQECLQGIENALASEVFTAVHLTLSPGLEPEAEKWLERLAQLGVPAVSITSPARTQALASRLAELREHAAQVGLDLVWDLPAPYSQINPISLEVERGPARGASLYVEPDGDVLPGQGVDRLLGNLLHDPWPQIWSKALED